MNFLILGDRAGHYVKLLRAAALADGHAVCPIEPRELWTSVHSPRSIVGATSQGNSFAPPADILLVRTMPLGSLEQVIFRMNALHELQAAGVCVLNSPRSLELAIDKYLSLAQFSRLGLPVLPTRCAQTAERAMEDFHSLDSDTVVKPVFGGEGRGILRIENPDLAWRTFRTLERCASLILQQPYIHHGSSDIRVLFVGDKFYSIRRENQNDWRSNTSRGASTARCELLDEQLQIAQAARRASGAEIVGVDLITDEKDGNIYLLEVNAVPGWKGVAQCYSIDIAAEIIRFACSHAEQRRGQARN